MNTFKIYTQLSNAMLNNVMGTGTGVIGGQNTTLIAVFSGVAPTPATFATWVVSTLPATRLVTFSGYQMSPAASLSASLIPNIPTATATTSGIATWFVAYVQGGDGAMLMGDISDMAGTATFRLNDTNIVTGQIYTIQNIAITMPNTFTF